jgi:hypothetical protein
VRVRTRVSVTIERVSAVSATGTESEAEKQDRGAVRDWLRSETKCRELMQRSHGAGALPPSREDSLRMFGVADQRRPRRAGTSIVAGVTDTPKLRSLSAHSWRLSPQRSRKLASVVSHEGDERLSR